MTGLLLYVLILFIIVDVVLGLCGSLKANSVYEGGIAVGRIRLYPNDPLWKPWIEKRNYQWVKENPPEIIAYYREGKFFTYKQNDNISETNFTLEIRGMKTADEDSYRVECFNDGRKVHNSTKPVLLELPSRGESTQPTLLTSSQFTLGTGPVTPGPALNLASDGDKGVIVVIVMSFVIVTLVVVILALVIRMKVKARQTRRDGQLIAKEESEMQPILNRLFGWSEEKVIEDDYLNGSESGQQQGENVYNEIDDYAEMDPDITYARVKDTGLFTSQPNITPGFSPSLPKRDHGISKSVENITMSSSQNDLNPRMSKAQSSLDVYAKVIPKSLRGKKNNEYENTADSKTVNIHVEDCSSDKTVVLVRKPQRSTLKRGGNQYKSMDCILSETPSEEYHEFSNTLPRSIKRNGSKKELVYIEIDHGRRASIPNHYELEPQVIGEPSTAQYVSIDFDKKAFVAPIRKAPSSWYRKRQERKEKKKQQKK